MVLPPKIKPTAWRDSDDAVSGDLMSSVNYNTTHDFQMKITLNIRVECIRK